MKLAIISGWLLLGFLAYKVSQFDYEMSNFDPYEILGLPPGSTQAEIKRSYRKQSLILHPDKETGDEKAFMKLTKAYQVSNLVVYVHNCCVYQRWYQERSVNNNLVMLEFVSTLPLTSLTVWHSFSIAKKWILLQLWVSTFNNLLLLVITFVWCSCFVFF